ncbi:HNH endonuclease [Sediminicola luteus]|uniref:HNH endonuclease n=1 Tax=Sediminicola luteus TaxID=319238 RepID=A0A2A4GDU4_9FLAO|nr:HNH endonuclease [Sediminicola luteus]PCE66623.1 HNH endonuclease [Sediminicola luteus]
MIKSYWNEEWKPILFDEKISKHEKFKISNYGRVLNCKIDPDENTLAKPSYIGGYLKLTVRQVSKKTTTRYVHKLVAQHFIKKDSDEQKYVIHKDYDKTNNHVDNLKWVTRKEKENHQLSNPAWREAASKVSYSKLTETKVKLIKKKLNDPNRRTRLKMIAKQFGISEMQLYRIKTGENWGYVTVD